jgi:AraC-like DNA-binding protein
MLESGDEGLPVVAERTGVGSPETMRRAFLRELGVTPGAYRAQFRTTGIGGNGHGAGDGDLWRARSTASRSRRPPRAGRAPTAT